MAEKQDSEVVRTITSDNERIFSARAVQMATGLTSRQLNDWDERGALPHSREGEVGWRRFSIREIFALMVCVELRNKFDVSVERVKHVQEIMLKDGADYFIDAANLMESLGLGVWLLTDFGSTLIMDSELKFKLLWEYGFFGGDGDDAYALLKLNPLVNRLLSYREEPLFLPANGRGRELMTISSVETKEECEALKLIRSGDYESVEIVAPNGKIETLYATAQVDPTADLNQIRREHPFQTLTVKMKDGKTHSVTQQKVIKPSRPKGQPQ